MAIVDVDQIDFAGIDPEDGTVNLLMFEDRDWVSLSKRAEELESKVNGYLDFVFGGLMEQREDFRGRPVKIVLHTRLVPPSSTAQLFSQLQRALSERSIRFQVFVGPGRAHPWAVEP